MFSFEFPMNVETIIHSDDRNSLTTVSNKIARLTIDLLNEFPSLFLASHPITRTSINPFPYNTHD